ncbi:DUF3188 domain-containing protein [Enterococcus nangangensis]|uniref:DUF3188 domain-containing protein n=1 Tax=Enterococcus nangangensis TaxID=2559926 RepID=UPI0010F783C7|nr:DUF3188 domain-containing protein [Enterococcus nangangensis]
MQKKYGLCLISIGLLVFVHAVNQNTGNLNLLNVMTSLFLSVVGLIMFRNGRKKEKEVKDHGNS